MNSGSVSLSLASIVAASQIKGTARQRLSRHYIVKDGPLSISGTASLTGKDVGFYLTGSNAVLNFIGNTTINLEGPKDGDLRGSCSMPIVALHPLQQTSSAAPIAHTLTGTIYLPRGNLLVDPVPRSPQNSAYTAIIANQINVNMGPELVLNSNYGATPCPLPDGIKASADVVLAD